MLVGDDAADSVGRREGCCECNDDGRSVGGEIVGD